MGFIKREAPASSDVSFLSKQALESLTDTLRDRREDAFCESTKMFPPSHNSRGARQRQSAVLRIDRVVTLEGASEANHSIRGLSREPGLSETSFLSRRPTEQAALAREERREVL